MQMQLNHRLTTQDDEEKSYESLEIVEVMPDTEQGAICKYRQLCLTEQLSVVEVYFPCYDESTFAERRFNITFVGVGQCILSGLEM